MPKKKITKKEKRRLVLIMSGFIIMISIMCVNILPDWLKISKNKKEYALLQKNYNDLLNDGEALVAEVQKLKNPEYAERYAKERYLYTKPNEIIIRKTGNSN